MSYRNDENKKNVFAVVIGLHEKFGYFGGTVKKSISHCNLFSG